MSKRFGLGMQLKKKMEKGPEVKPMDYNTVYYSELEDRLFIAPRREVLTFEANENDNREAAMIAIVLAVFKVVEIGDF